MDFYSEEEAKLEKQVSELTEESLQSPLGYVFVTFDNLNSSKQVFDDYQRSLLFCVKYARIRQSSQSASLNSDQWSVTFAPGPEDLIWENLHPTKLSQKIAIVGVDLVMILVGLFFTTPQIIGEKIHDIAKEVAGDHLDGLPDVVIDLIDMVLVLMASSL